MSGDCPRATPVPTGAISKRSKALTTRPDARPGQNIRQAYARARRRMARSKLSTQLREQGEKVLAR